MRIEGNKAIESLESKSSQSLRSLSERIKTSNSKKPDTPTLKGRSLKPTSSKKDLFKLRDL